MASTTRQSSKKILLTGPTGFIGKRLLYKLDEKGYQIRCLVRPPEFLDLLRPLIHEPEIIYGDLLDRDYLEAVLEGMDAAYYLVHSMSGRSIRETLAFEIMRYLVERLPILTCPKWVYTKSQPIAIDNVLSYLAGCL
ncbi:MAG: hypothetical protein DRH26_14230 [Deltaproteobacteria bacterium]|nr:MAG: hypothetical protein DRH26_14230 [Deltaproteobacteria bacterium]